MVTKVWTREEQLVIDKIEDKYKQTYSDDFLLQILEENDLTISEALFILYEAGHIKFPEYYEIDTDG